MDVTLDVISACKFFSDVILHVILWHAWRECALRAPNIWHEFYIYMYATRSEIQSFKNWPRLIWKLVKLQIHAMRANQYICIFSQCSEFRIQNMHSTFICVFSVNFQNSEFWKLTENTDWLARIACICKFTSFQISRGQFLRAEGQRISVKSRCNVYSDTVYCFPSNFGVPARAGTWKKVWGGSLATVRGPPTSFWCYYLPPKKGTQLLIVKSAACKTRRINIHAGTSNLYYSSSIV